MVNERALQEAFSKIKQEFSSIKGELESLRNEIGGVKSLKETVDSIKDKLSDVGQDDYVETAEVETKTKKNSGKIKKEELVQVQTDNADSYY